MPNALFTDKMLAKFLTDQIESQNNLPTTKEFKYPEKCKYSIELPLRKGFKINFSVDELEFLKFLKMRAIASR
ncbi:MAG: hypothetical protein F6K35_14330 [Okeania sp. SIO2H7]|nr:hypothetical protein [Okeania sp. SIO2H7]